MTTEVKEPVRQAETAAPKPEPTFSFTDAFDKAYQTKPADKSLTASDSSAGQLKEGWQKGDANATAAFKGMGDQLTQFDTAEEAVRKSQTDSKAFTDIKGANGEVKRTYADPTLAGFEHTFNNDPAKSVDLKVPASANLGFESIRFSGDTATVTMPGKEGKPGETRQATADELKKLDDVFKKAGGEFKIPGLDQPGRYTLDARGNANIAQVPGMPEGSTMSVKPPNSPDDLRYHAEVKETADKPGYSTEATGTKADGYRFVDYVDGKEPKAQNGQAIEGFVAKRSAGFDNPPLTLLSNNPVGDGSTTTIHRDRTAETKFGPNDAKGRLLDVQFPDGSSATRYDPARSQDGVRLEQRNGQGTYTERITKSGEFQVTSNSAGQEFVAGFKSEADAVKAPNSPAWSRQTDTDGTVSTKYPPGHPSGLESSTFNPGPPPAAKLKGPGGADITDAQKIADFLKTPPVVTTETLSDGRTRDVLANGQTVTTDAKTGIKKTETATQSKTEWPADKAPDKAALAKLTGLKPDDPRLEGVTGITEGKGKDAGTLKLSYDSTKQKDGRSFVEIKRDPAGNEVSETRDGIRKDGDKSRPYVERLDKQNNTTTREYAGPPQGNMEVRETNADFDKGALKYSRTVSDDGKVTTTDVARNRTEVRDYKNSTWSVKEGDKTTQGTMRPGEKGQTLFVDSDGKLTGMEFTEGRRKGESYKFSRGPDGNMNGMEINIPARDNQPAQRVSLVKEGENWKTNPPGQKVPGFDKAVADGQGNIKGDFSTTAKGDMMFQTADKQVKEVLRGNGGRDTYNQTDYSRIRENPDGTKGPTKYWDGYGSKNNPEDGWREGKVTKVGGATVVEFTPPLEGHPSKMTRDGSPKADGTFNNKFDVEFPNGTKFSVNDWNEGKMQRTTNGQTDTIYNTGATGNDGRVQWAKGREEGGKVIFDDPRVASGELPKEAVIDKKTGDVDSTYGDGSKVTTDSGGKPKQIRPGHKGAEAITPMYGPNGEFKGYKQGDRTITKGPDGADGNSTWTINQNGKELGKINGKVNERPGGKFDITGANGDKYESNGRFTTKENGKDTVYDARGQKWQTTPGDATANPPTKATITFGDPPKAVPGDKLKMYDNGNVGVQNGEFVDMYNPDKSVSKIDKNGIERQRNNADGTYIKRDAIGALTEFKTANGDVTTLSYEKTADGRPALTGAETKNQAGQTVRLEKPYQGKLRTSELDAAGKEKVPPVYGNEVSYDRMGTRSEVQRTKEGTVEGSVRTSTDIHGKKVSETKQDAAGRLIEGPTPAGDGRLNYQWGTDPKDTTPASITKDGKPYGTRKGAGDSNLYDVGGKEHRLENGVLKPNNDNAGLDPCNTVHMERTANPDRPGTTPDTPAGLDDASLTQRYKLDAAVVPTIRNFAKGLGMEVTPQNMDKFLKAATENGLAQSLTPASLQQIGSDLGQLMQNPQAQGFIKSMMSDPAKLAQFAQNAQALEQLKGQLPASLQPFVNQNFIAALLKPAQVQPPAPGPRRGP